MLLAHGPLGICPIEVGMLLSSFGAFGVVWWRVVGWWRRRL